DLDEVDRIEAQVLEGNVRSVRELLRSQPDEAHQDLPDVVERERLLAHRPSWAQFPSRMACATPVRRRRYSSRSREVRAASVQIAASATATGTWVSRRRSNGFGIRYSRPNSSRTGPSPGSGVAGSRASAAIARVAASFIGSLIARARTSSAPRKM